MGLLHCFCCGRQREVKPIRKGAAYTCGNCGAKQVRIVRSKHQARDVSWTEKDGVSEYEAKHQTYAGLRRHAEHRGYKKAKGWCAVKFKEIFGRWPNGEAVESAAPASAGLLWWIRKQNAAYRKRRKAEEFRLANLEYRLPLRAGSDVDSGLMSADDWAVRL